MIDHFSILLSHGLLLLAYWRLLHRPDLDIEQPRKAMAEQLGLGDTPDPKDQGACADSDRR
ncbi:MAG: hypothetical protein OSA47_11025 [Novosphingopyxis baekryungensis]|nr:hypothetical protein [Novosphingopyxis baekryungensis]